VAQEKKVVFTEHARIQMGRRGVTEGEVRLTIQIGESIPAKKGRTAYRKNFPFESVWKGKFYTTKQVSPVIVKQEDEIVVVTVYAYYFTEETYENSL
jgi:hypothetical protein